MKTAASVSMLPDYATTSSSASWLPGGKVSHILCGKEVRAFLLVCIVFLVLGPAVHFWFLNMENAPFRNMIQTNSCIEQTTAHVWQPPILYMPKNKNVIPNTFGKLPLMEIIDPYQHRVQCRDVRRFGGPGDGGWDVCFDGMHDGFPDDCLVYSFGIAFDWTFDYAISEHMNCEVHAFDHTIHGTTGWKARKIFFHNLGLSDKDQKAVRTLATIRKMLGHTKRTIHYLKMDVEGAEWRSLNRAIKDGSLNNVAQLGLEVHFKQKSTGEYQAMQNGTELDVLRKLENIGFASYKSHLNPLCPRCWELYYTRKINA